MWRNFCHHVSYTQYAATLETSLTYDGQLREGFYATTAIPVSIAASRAIVVTPDDQETEMAEDVKVAVEVGVAVWKSKVDSVGDAVKGSAVYVSAEEGSVVGDM